MLTRFKIRLLLTCGPLAGWIFFSLCTRPIRIPGAAACNPGAAADNPGAAGGGGRSLRCPVSRSLGGNAGLASAGGS